MKKYFYYAGLTLFVASFAQAKDITHYREYSGNLIFGSKLVSIRLKVDTEVKDLMFGDPVLPDHGFIRKQVKIHVNEGNVGCDSTAESDSIDSNRVDLVTCSGLRIAMKNLNALLKDETSSSLVYLSSSDQSIGEMSLKLDEVIDDDGSDPRI